MTLRVPFAASSVAMARRKLKQWMADSHCSPEQIEDARVVISELIANSIRHARPLPDGHLLVSWHRDARGLELEVSDGGGATRPRKVQAPSSALAGRGMAIVDTLAAAWWTEQSQTRTTVHAILHA